MQVRNVGLIPVFVFALTTFAFSDSPDWNQWRGPNRDGKVQEAAWPEALKDRLSPVWEKPHGPSYSGPIISQGLVFTTETLNKATEQVTAYDLKTGEQKWQVSWPGAMSVPFFAASNGDWIRSTPICTETDLVVLGMRDVLVNLDPQTGKEKWRVDFPAQLGSELPAFGAVCSPIIDGDAIYVQTGGAVVKLSLADGSTIWKTLENNEGMMSSGAFSSPVIATIADTRQLIVQTRLELCGVNLETGDVFWKKPIDAFRGMNILTPLVFGDRIFTSAHSGKAQLLEIKHTADGKWQVGELWSQSSQAYMSSPLLINDSIFMHMKNQRVAMLNVADGSNRWTSTPYGQYWSMVQGGEKVLALDNAGDLLLIQPSNSALNIVDKVKVASNSWAHLAVQNDLVIVRDLAALKVFQWK
jgi:outer membrane protein assembly factor BamB